MKIRPKLFSELLSFYKKEVEKSNIRSNRQAGHPAGPAVSRNKKQKKKSAQLQMQEIVNDSIHCSICGEQVPKGKYKIHRIKKHGASKIILEKSSSTASRERRALPKYTNIARPWCGGAPGGGKKK